MDIELHCRCGHVRGVLDAARGSTRMICYCRDCQAYARWLGHEARLLDRDGGSDIVAITPAALRFTAGRDAITSLSLAEGGLLRWYCSHCRTPIGNTPRTPKAAYVGLMRDFVPLEDADMDGVFGRARLHIQTGSALAPVRSTPLAALIGTARIVGRLLAARVGGGWRHTPLFDATTAKALRAPQVLTPTERRALEPAPRRA